MTTITGKVGAYLGEYSSLGADDFKAPTDELVGKLFYATADCIPKGWTLVGTATITVELVHQDNVIANKVASLRAGLQKHRADSRATDKRLEDQISKLLAISYDGAAA